VVKSKREYETNENNEINENNETNEKIGKFHMKSKLANGFNTKGQRDKGSKGDKCLIFFFFEPLSL